MKRHIFRQGAIVMFLLLLWPALAAAKVKPPVVSGGLYHTLTIKADGTLWACGRNVFGQLGVGDNTDRSTPVQVGTAKDWVAVAAGADHSLGIRANGSLWAWGYNYYGQLGLGNNTSFNTPQPVPGPGGWVAVAAGQGHSLGIKADGTIWSWGWNDSGQLGLGAVGNVKLPTPPRRPCTPAGPRWRRDTATAWGSRPTARFTPGGTTAWASWAWEARSVIAARSRSPATPTGWKWPLVKATAWGGGPPAPFTPGA